MLLYVLPGTILPVRPAHARVYRPLGRAGTGCVLAALLSRLFTSIFCLGMMRLCVPRHVRLLGSRQRSSNACLSRVALKAGVFVSCIRGQQDKLKCINMWYMPSWHLSIPFFVFKD
jgi:hypothetical protein